MKECDVLAFGTKARCLVDQANASGATALERFYEVVNDEAHVVYARSPSGDELAYR